jgi:hypothetical protein
MHIVKRRRAEGNDPYSLPNPPNLAKRRDLVWISDRPLSTHSGNTSHPKAVMRGP